MMRQSIGRSSETWQCSAAITTSLNVIKTKEMIVDYRRAEHALILIDGAVVGQVKSFKFVGVHITNKLSWSKHTKTVVKKTEKI